jgi:multiple sugar transport system substrate-binding protein
LVSYVAYVADLQIEYKTGVVSMRIRTMGLAAAAVMTLAIAAGCSGKQEQPEVQKEGNAAPPRPELSKEPIVLKFFSHAVSVNTDDEMNELLLKPIQKQYPNITFQRVTGDLNKMISSGDLPDLIGTSNVWIRDMIAMGVADNLTPLIQRDKLDMSAIEPGALEVLRKSSKNGEIVAMPYAMNYGTTVYNKDIFDRFGVPYPKDNMTWNETIELSKRLTKLDNGTQIIGVDMEAPHNLTRSYSLPAVDSANKAVLTGPGYKKVFDLYAMLYAIPGMVDSKGKYVYGAKGFFDDQILAMYPYWLTNTASRMQTLKQAGKAFNWDVATWPAFDDKPGIGRQFDFHVMIVPPTSKNKEAAFRVMETLIGKEAQMAMNRGTRLTVLQDPALKKQFASDLGLFAGRNLEGVFKVKPAPYEIASPYDAAINKIMETSMKDVATNGLDVNTALRNANEAANKEIEQQKK